MCAGSKSVNLHYILSNWRNYRGLGHSKISLRQDNISNVNTCVTGRQGGSYHSSLWSRWSISSSLRRLLSARIQTESPALEGLPNVQPAVKGLDAVAWMYVVLYAGNTDVCSLAVWVVKSMYVFEWLCVSWYVCVCVLVCGFCRQCNQRGNKICVTKTVLTDMLLPE